MPKNIKSWKENKLWFCPTATKPQTLSSKANIYTAWGVYNGTHAGYVTSGGFAPSLSNAVALGYIISDINPQPGMLCQINTGRAVLDGTLVELPFYKESSLKSKIG
jgi:glycine cleavage system aminomethyltransferase T